jgi:hypothetical protein
MSSGSLGRALQFLRDPDSLLVQPAVEFFSARKQDNRAVLAVLRRLAGVPPPALVGSLLFLHREALRVRLGLDSEYAQRNPAVGRRAAQEDAGYWRRSVKYLVGRNADCGQYGLNPKLFTYTLLSAIRQRAGG